MAFLSDAASGILTPEEVGELITRPIQDESVALRPEVATVVNTNARDFRIPIVDIDAAAAWVPEGFDIDLTDPVTRELVVRPLKVAALVKVSSELAQDSSPEATAVVQASLARSVARRIDSAFFGDSVTNGPSGLQSLADTQFVTAGSAFTNLDWAVEAKTKLRKVGSTATAFVAAADTVADIETLKTEANSNQPLLASTVGDATKAVADSVLGVPLVSVADGTNLPDGRVWAVDKAKVFVVIRRDVTLDVSTDYFFGSDSLAVRVTCRVGFGFPHQQAIVAVGVGGS
ncbi:phage major capsid protein [Mycobacterium sp. SMC-4]|uniref:phage major capsid protein n=1 Tax=Mycobacterium sp. SMC-4 TaxID=2857059 RepID=UPI0021B4ACC5|nr:phage major capsid protein [Mycobacterium sp. SMC-4]UXA19821.1 phage major capsid protein [Mycobacterium sp. SMC-4]